MYFIPRGGGSRSVLWVPPEHCACPGTKSSLTRNMLTAAAAEAAVGIGCRVPEGRGGGGHVFPPGT